VEQSVQEFLSLAERYKGSEIAQALERTSRERLENARSEKNEQLNGGGLLFIRQTRKTLDSPIYCGLDFILYAGKGAGTEIMSPLIENGAFYSAIKIVNIDPPPISHLYSDANDKHLYSDAPSEEIIRERVKKIASALEAELKELRSSANAVVSVPRTEYKKTQRLDPFVVRTVQAVQASKAYQSNTKDQISKAGSIQKHT